MKIRFGLLLLFIIFACSVQAGEIERFQVPILDSPRLGSDQAPVTVIEFLDFQ